MNDAQELTRAERPGCVPNGVIRGMWFELGDRAFGDLMTEWLVPAHALSQRFRWAGLTAFPGQGRLELAS